MNYFLLPGFWGVRCSFFICFDLRFGPDFWEIAAATDVFIVVANWPEVRRNHWKSLLKARAIENTNCSNVFLHGHNIATYDHATQSLKISSCGWETVTTKSRLNAILNEVFGFGAGIFQKQFNWFLSFGGQTVDFFDGMILLNSREVA